MTKRNALIFSKSDAVSKIVFAELSMLGYTPKTVQDLPSQQEAELIVFDATELELSPSVRSYLLSCNDAKKLAIVKEASEKLSSRFDKIFEFPFLLCDFRDYLLNVDEKLNTDNKSPANSKCFVADKDKKGVSFNDVFIPLSEYELKLLNLLCLNSGKCVSKEDILNLFEAGDSNIAEVYICHLRNKLEAPFGIKVIHTLRGRGYMTDYSLI